MYYVQAVCADCGAYNEIDTDEVYTTGAFVRAECAECPGALWFATGVFVYTDNYTGATTRLW